MPRALDRPLGVAALLGLGLALEAACVAVTLRYGVWSLVFGQFEYFWVYGAAVLFYLGSCASIWVFRPSGRFASCLVLGLAVVFRLTLLVSPTAPFEDIYRYIWDGHILAEGINPYLLAPSAPELAQLAIPALSQVSSPNVITPYPPLAEGLFAALYILFPGSVLAVKAVVALADLATIGLIAVILRDLGRPIAWTAIYAWSPLTIQEFAGHGHLDALWLPLFLGAVLLADQGKRRVSGLALALATLLKAVPALLVPALLGRWRLAGLITFALVACLGFTPFLGAGPQLMAGATTMLERWEANSSLYHWLQLANQRWDLTLDADHPARRAGAIVVAGAMLTALLWRPRTLREMLAASFWILATAILVSATVYPWYAAWLLPPLAVLLATGEADPLRPAYAAWTLFAALTFVHYLAHVLGYLPEWARIVEYAPAYLGTAWAGLVILRRRRGPTSPARRPTPIAASSPRVGVVIPTLNEAAAIGRVIAEIPREYAGSVVVVDGGSTDGTPDIARAAGARVVGESRRGYGRACLTGLESLPADVNVVVFLDGDLSDYPGQMARLVEPVATGQADLVVGSRLRGRRERGALPPHSVLGNWLAALLMRILYRLPITDLGPFRAVRRDLLDGLEMTEMTYGWPVEMLAKAARAGLCVLEVPVDYRRRLGHSKITGTVRGSLFASYFILSRVFRYLRG